MTTALENEIPANRPIQSPHPAVPKGWRPYKPLRAPMQPPLRPNPTPKFCIPSKLLYLWAGLVLRSPAYARLRKPKQYTPPGPFLIFPCAHGPTRLDTLPIFDANLNPGCSNQSQVLPSKPQPYAPHVDQARHLSRATPERL